MGKKKSFEKTAFEGDKGRVIDPIKTQFEWHLIKFLEKIILLLLFKYKIESRNF